jgi:glutamine amidotransferase-like uncharacterized protein/N-formylglutamate amidohydrolase
MSSMVRSIRFAEGCSIGLKMAICFWIIGSCWTHAQEAPVREKTESTSTQTIDASERKPLVANNYVWVQSGQIPIIVSAPHGGNLTLPDVPARKGEGLETGASGFFTGRDSGTEELALEVADAIRKRFGKDPYYVISRVHRRFLDPNRPVDIAIEDPRVKPIYDHYHGSMKQFCEEVTERFQVGLVIDLHGQGSRRDTVFRGTKNGLSVSRLRQTFGESSHTGPASLFGMLHARGWTVHPMPLDGSEQSGYTGGYITQSYGSHRGLPIDAMQLEMGAEYRVPSRREQTAEVLADALAEYANAYLKMTVPVRTTPLKTFTKRPIQVAVFVDEGVGPTKVLFKALESDPRLSATKVSAEDIRAGKLDEFSVLIHPGGSGSGQGKALGEVGREKVRDFVKAGNGLVGICAGAYLASCDYDWSLHVLDAKVIDRKHWNRGYGNVTLSITPMAKDLFHFNSSQPEMYYHQGPLLAPAENPAVPDFQALASFDSEIAMNGAPTGVMKGTTAIAAGDFGKGRVLCFSPHPEKTPSLEHVLLDGIQWVVTPRVSGSSTSSPAAAPQAP